jgi:hypothetical protein
VHKDHAIKYNHTGANIGDVKTVLQAKTYCVG